MLLYYVDKVKLRVFENRILRRIVGPKRDENGEWRRLHNEELHEVAGSIPGTYTNFKCGLGPERGPANLVRTIG